MNILYLEDDPANLALIERVATLHHDHLTTVQHPSEALEALQAEVFDLIITDIHLGINVMDGLDFTAFLRENGLNTPIIAITAYDFDDYRRRSEEVGTNYHIVKPVSVNDLIQLFNEFRV